MSVRRQWLGKRGEELAKRHLESTGYSILDTNYRAESGEIDLVAEKDGTLVFVEVRARSSARLGLPEESLTPKKRSHMVGAAQEYIQANQVEEREWRIDLVAIEFSPDGRLERLDVIENAVEL